MDKAFEIIPVAGLIEELDLSPEELSDIRFNNSLLNPNLNLDCKVINEPYGTIYFEVDVIEVIPPNTKKNNEFFRKSFSNIYAEEEGERKLTAFEIERNFELDGERWILVGGIVKQKEQLVPPAIIIAYYKESGQALYTIFIQEELQYNIFTHPFFRVLN